MNLINLYNYHLPKEHIANTPADPRDHSKLMVLNRKDHSINHHHFYDLPNFLTDNDVLVLNETKVFPSRIRGQKSTGGKIELLLLKQVSTDTWESMSKPSLKPGQQLQFNDLHATVIQKDPETGYAHIQFNLTGQDLLNAIFDLGLTPLPPYIENHSSEQTVRDQYQTTYAKHIGSSAAPTAGLHFTKQLLQSIKDKGVKVEYITLHVGPGTFQNLREENIQTSKLHSEEYEINEATANRLNQYKQEGRRIIAVGTTSTRTLEAASTTTGQITAGKSSTQIFIFPPYQFRFVDALITNFHLPQSSLLMLVSALTSTPNTKDHFTTFQDSYIGHAYQQAISNDYRFFSFGDAMFIQ